MELNLYRFPDDTVHVSQLLGQNTCGVYLDTVAQVNAVFCRCMFFRMVEMDVSMMFFDPSLNQTPILSDVHPFTIIGDTAYT
jgi:hypothetical protein